MKDPDYSHTNEIVCPYCGAEQCDSWELFLDDREDAEDECGECGKAFFVTQHVSVTYSSSKKEPLCPK